MDEGKRNSAQRDLPKIRETRPSYPSAKRILTKTLSPNYGHDRTAARLFETVTDVMPPGPDFICIGMPKAGTSWLFDQLHPHPDFWMPPVKEIHYLQDSAPKQKPALRLMKQRREQPDRLPDRFLTRRPWDQRDTAFLEYAVSIAGQPWDMNAYAGLFQFKGELLSGDITPAYSALEPAEIRPLMARFPDLRLVFLVREPVARAWSHFCMLSRIGRVPADIHKNPRRFRALFNKKKFSKRFFPSRAFQTWAENVPSGNLRFFFFDDLVVQPEKLRADILRFLGADPDKASGTVPAGGNRKAGRNNLEFTDELKAILVEEFAGELSACAELFEGPAKSWPSLYGIAL